VIAGVDLGGTQVRVAVARDDDRPLGSARARTATLRTPDELAGWVAGQVRRLSGGEPVGSVAIGVPGPVDPWRGMLVNPPNLPWKNLPLATLLAEAVGAPVHLENDANLAALGEHHRGAGRGTRTMVYVTWSTGVGGGLILDGRLFSGAHGTAGEIGHMIVDPSGPADSCGQRGCLEVFCGGAALSRQTGESAAELFRAAAGGDPDAVRIVRRAASYMGQALINLANLFDPEVIVLGGGVTASWSTVAPTLREVLAGSPFIKPSRRPAIRRARLGDAAGLAGALRWARTNL
jgi:glucokinase